MFILLDGKMFEAGQYSRLKTALGVWGIQENIQVDDGRGLFLGHYLARMKKAAGYLKVGIPGTESLRKDILKLIQLNCMKKGSVRILAWRDTASEVTHTLVRPEAYYRQYPRSFLRRGMRITVSDSRLDQRDAFHRFKMISRPRSSNDFFEKEYQQATAAKMDEVLFLNINEKIAECSRSNIFFILRGKVFTPSLDCGCFPGVTRGIVLDILKAWKMPYRQGRFSLVDALEAEEVFLTNSSMKVVPVVRIGDVPLPTIRHGRIWKRLRDEYIRREHEDGAV